MINLTNTLLLVGLKVTTQSRKGAQLGDLSGLNFCSSVNWGWLVGLASIRWLFFAGANFRLSKSRGEFELLHSLTYPWTKVNPSTIG